ncbi:hypothetical protein J6590_063436 [Homalodisca vitripennis]|nr:hypothetical protein J6590_063436 [Homalodisca vitripennis]
MGFNYLDVPIAEIEHYYKLMPLSSRRKLSDLTLLRKILNGKIDCPALLSLFNIRMPSGTRGQHLVATGLSGKNYQLHSPIPRLQREDNSVARLVDFFADPKAAFKKSVVRNFVYGDLLMFDPVAHFTHKKRTVRQVVSSDGEERSRMNALTPLPEFQKAGYSCFVVSEILLSKSLREDASF